MSWQSSVPPNVNHPLEPSTFSWDGFFSPPPRPNALALDLGLGLDSSTVNPLQAESEFPQVQPPFYPPPTVDDEPLLLHSPNRTFRPPRRRRPYPPTRPQNALMLETEYPSTPFISTVSLPGLFPESATQLPLEDNMLSLSLDDADAQQEQAPRSILVPERPCGVFPRVENRHRVQFAEGIQSPTPKQRKRRPRLRLHKYLVVADRLTNMYELSLVDWNVEEPPRTAKVRVKDFDTVPMTEEQRHELASNVRLTRMTLKSKDFMADWSITVERNSGLACSDVFQAIYMFLQEPLTQEEFYLIPHGTLKPCVQAFTKRCSKANIPLSSGFQEGMKRVDYLGGKTIFSGLYMQRESFIQRARPDDCVFEIMFMYGMIPLSTPIQWPKTTSFEGTDWPWITPWSSTPEDAHLPMSELRSYIAVDS